MVYFSQNDMEQVAGAPHCYSAFASDLGLRPGSWPAFVSTDIGNGRDFVAEPASVHEGEITSVRYVQEFGCIVLIVYND